MNETFKNNYLFSLEQQRKKEESKWEKADERAQHYANAGNTELMHHFLEERAGCEGAINALTLAAKLFEIGATQQCNEQRK